jgi:FkbM family methyltransferase
MSFHPAAVFRRSAQVLRHAPGLRRFAPVWDRLRTPYRSALIALAGSQGMPVTVGGHVMRLAPDVVSLNWETVEVGSYRTFAESISSGDVVFDVGAHFGTYSMIAAWRGADVRVVAYEPSPLTRSYLTRHLEWNGLSDRVVVRDVCCSANQGMARFFVHPERPEGINGLMPDHGLVETQVRCTTVDAEAAELGAAPTFLKIDVEGAELDVLAGSTQVLARHAPRILVSLHPRRLAMRGQSVADAMTWLCAHDYRPAIIDEDQEVHVLAQRR